MKTKIAGLYLWAVEVRGTDEPDHYWFTTRWNSALNATEKAGRFFRKEFGYLKTIRSVKSHGTIDA